MASKKKNLTTIDERTRSQNSRYDPFHHLEQRQGRTVFGCLLGHFCSRHWRVAVRVFNAPEALSLTSRCRGGGVDFYLKYEEYEFMSAMLDSRLRVAYVFFAKIVEFDVVTHIRDWD